MARVVLEQLFKGTLKLSISESTFCPFLSEYLNKMYKLIDYTVYTNKLYILIFLVMTRFFLSLECADSLMGYDLMGNLILH
jgi:hypothetical protein